MDPIQLYLFLCLIIFPEITSAEAESNFDVPARCATIPKMPVIPGFGFDSLSSTDMSSLLQLTYNECKVTNDGKFLVPDGMEATVIKAKDVQMTEDLIEQYSSYTTTTAKNFQVSGGFPVNLFRIKASYSEEYRSMKSIQVRNRAFTLRVQLRSLLYRVFATPDVPLTKSLNRRFLNIMKAANRNHTDKAKYLLETILRDYGTHFTRSVDAGAVLIKEDFLKESFLRDNYEERSRIIAAAKVSMWNDTFSFSIKNEQSSSKSILEEYNEARVDQTSTEIGGPDMKKDMNADKWLAETINNMAPIDRSGDLITSLITPSRFPNAPTHVLIKVSNMLDQTLVDYYNFNVRKGCTKMTSKNFNYAANLDDDSCQDTPYEHYFGGVYQTCTQPRNINLKNACADQTQVKNDLTGNFSCPKNFETKRLRFQNVTYKYQVNHPKRKCSGWFIFESCGYEANWVTYSDVVALETFQCTARANPELIQTSYQFGGGFSPNASNVHTKKDSCPPQFRSVSVIGSGILSICIKNNIGSNHYSLNFGGLTSCEMGLACPSGYFGHLAATHNGCQINYCLYKTITDDSVTEPMLVRPPFTNGEYLFQDKANNDADYDDYGVPFPTTTDPLKYNTENISERKQKDEKEKVILGVSLTLSFVALFLLVGLVIWRRRKGRF